MTKEEIQSDISKLDEIKAMIDAVTTADDIQDDTNLVALLESEYKLSAKAKKEILSIVNGKKPKAKSSKSSNKREERNICGDCVKVGVNYEDENGKFVGYETLKKRIAQKKNQLTNKLK